MSEFSRSETPFIQCNPQEQAVPQEQKDFLAGLLLLGQTFGDFHTSLTQIDQDVRALLPLRRNLEGNFDVFKRQITSAIAMAKELQERAASVVQADSFSLRIRQIYDAETKRLSQKLFVSTQNSSTNLGAATEGLAIELLYRSPMGELAEIRYFPQETVANASGAESSYQGKHLTIRQELMESHAHVLAYVQMMTMAEYMPLLKSPALLRIRESTSANISKDLLISPEHRLIIFHGLRGLSNSLIAGQQKGESQQ